MIVVRDFDRLKGKELVATIGFFDGVHLGHRFLIDEMKEIAKARNLPSAVITFVIGRCLQHLDTTFGAINDILLEAIRPIVPETMVISDQ